MVCHHALFGRDSEAKVLLNDLVLAVIEVWDSIVREALSNWNALKISSVLERSEEVLMEIS